MGARHRAVLIDANNVRGASGFPELSAFTSAAARWAEEASGCAALRLIAVDHGMGAEAFALSGSIAVVFAGERTDADTVIVHTVDWLLSETDGTRDASSAAVVVVTSDHLLRQRCTHELPTVAGDAFGAKRPRAQLARLSFEGSAAFANNLAWGVQDAPLPSPRASDGLISGLLGRRHRSDEIPSASRLLAASPPRSSARSTSPGVVLSRRSRRKAQKREDALRVGPHHEKTEDRSRAASVLHALVSKRCGAAAAFSGQGQSDSVADCFVRWYTHECALTAARRTAVSPFLTAATAATAAMSTVQQPQQRQRSSGDGARATAQVPLEDLCAYRRLKPDTGWMMVALICLWAPVGAALIAVRMLLTTIAGVVLVGLRSRWPATMERHGNAVMWGLFFLWGWRVRLSGDVEEARRRARLVVANHVSQVDALPVMACVPCATIVRESYANYPLVARILHAFCMPIFVPAPVPTGRDRPTEYTIALERSKHSSAAHARGERPRPLLIFPEGSITNGRRGLMRFAQWVFSLDEVVTPIAIRMRPALPLEADTVWAPLSRNIVWTLFQPFHVFELTLLPPAARADGERADAFAQRVAQSIAAHLDITATAHTSQEKAVHLQRVKAVHASGVYKW
jgi:1-acyl-sn-glycerol-3-phosphate acyltransferase